MSSNQHYDFQDFWDSAKLLTQISEKITLFLPQKIIQGQTDKK